MAIELEVQQADVVINTPIEIEVDNRLAAVTDVTNDLQVEINRKEYSIVGDELYIPSRYEDAPTWLQDVINQVVAVSIATEKGDLNQATESLNQLIAELEAAKNTYTQSIISSNDIDERINTAITTLNSTLAEADATILSVAQTKTTPEEAAALVIDGINAQLDTETGSIGAVIGALQQAVADGDSANATSIDTLASTITGEVDARVTAVNILTTAVEANGEDISANTQAITDLGIELNNGTNTWASADSTLENTLSTKIDNDTAEVESKFAYNSLLSVNGNYYNSGFGISSSVVSGTGSEVDPYNSEFWIDAERLVFTNSAQTGQASPFTIDASGTQPQITFNGKVSFNNVSNDPVAGNLVKFSWYASSDTLVDMKEQGWVNYSGSGETYLSPDGLKIGNNSGNDQQWLIYDKSIAINPNKRYKVTVEAQQTAGSGTAYFGFAGRNYNDTVWVNIDGYNSTSSQYYPISSWDIPTTMTIRESSYWSVGNLVEGSDYSIRTDVVYYRPLILVNYSGAAGTTIIKSFKIEEYEPAVDVSGDIADNNDMFAQAQGFANYAAMATAYSALGKSIINGGYINTGLVNADSIVADAAFIKKLLAQNIIMDTSTGVSSITSANGAMTIDFVNGSIYIR